VSEVSHRSHRSHRSQVSLRTLGQTYAIPQEAQSAFRWTGRGEGVGGEGGTGEGVGREGGTGKLEGGKEGGKEGRQGWDSISWEGVWQKSDTEGLHPKP
jgi:hypothetical protein